MKTVEKIETRAGDYYPDLVNEALAAVNELDIEYAAFDFNGVEVCVNQDTDLALLERDRNTAMYLDWQTVGPVCVAEYPPQVLESLKQHREESAAKAATRAEEQKTRTSAAVDTMKTIGVNDFRFTIPAAKQEYFDAEVISCAEAKESGYYLACIRWAKQIAICSLALSRESGKWIGAHLKEASYLTEEALDEGFTGFQHGAAIALLERYWFYGDVVRRARSMDLI